ncbi:MAG: response regulator [Verrucomicrobiota bacterium]
MATPPCHPVIVIEDDDTLLSSYKLMLEGIDKDIDLILCNCGRSGMEAIHRLTPSLVITDLRLPEIDGLAIVTKTVEKHPGVPIIVVSGIPGLDQVEEATEELSSLVTFVSKPFSPELFAGYVHTILRDQAESRLNGIRLLHIIQLISMENKSCHLEFVQGEHQGSISFDHGQVHYARTDDHDGLDALQQMARWEYPLTLIFNHRKTEKVNIDDPSVESILLQLCHNQDMAKTA